MNRNPSAALIRKALIRHGFEAVSDATLIVRYTRHRDSEAFTEMVNRYAGLVWGVCRRTCSDEHAAEDAFQATFLALSRQAGSIRRPECLSAWLHGVARRNAWKARGTAKPTGEALPDTADRAPSASEQLSGKELIEAVEAEIAKLPEKYRSALLDCWFDDNSLDAVARRIGVTKGTLWGRLKRGREMLQRRLAARGFGLPAVIAATVLTASSAPARLCDKAAQEAVRQSVHTAGSPMFGMIMLKWVAGVSLATGLIVGFANYFQTKNADQPPKKDAEPQAKKEFVDDGFPMPAGAVHRFGSRQLRHPDGIVGSAMSPDGKLLATMGAKSVIIWDLKTLTAKRVLSNVRCNTYMVDSHSRIAFSLDSKSVMFAVYPDQEVLNRGIRVDQKFDLAEVWDIETGKRKFALQSTYSYRSAVWPLANGKEVALHCMSGFGGPQGKLIIFDAATGKELRSENSRGSFISCRGVSNFVIDMEDGTGSYIVDASNGKEIAEVKGEAIQKALSPDGKRYVWSNREGMIHIFDIEKKEEIGKFEHPEKDKVGPMLISPDSKTLYFGSNHGRLFRWDLKENKKLADFANRHNYWSLTNLAISPDESTLYSMSMDKLIKRWNLKTGKELPLPEGYTTHTTLVTDVGGKHVIISDHEGQIDYWDLATGQRTTQLQASHLGGLNCIAQSNDGRWLVGGRTGQDLRLFDLTTGKVVRDIPLGDNSDATKWSDVVQRVRFSADGKIVYASSAKTGITAYEVPSGKQIWRAKTETPVFALDPQGRWIAVASGTGSEQIRWTMLDAKTGGTLYTRDVEPKSDAQQGRNGMAPYNSDLVPSPDGSRLYTSHYDGTVREWETESGKETKRVDIKVTHGMRLAVSPDGSLLALGGVDHSVSVYEIATWKPVMKMAGHDSPIQDLTFTKDGRGLISGADLAPVLWSLVPGSLPANDGAAWDALASDDGEKAYRMQWALIQDSSSAVKMFREKIKPEELSVDRAQLDKWKAALDHPQFRIREASEKELIKKGSLVPVSWLRKALTESKSDEQRARLERVLTQREKLSDPNDWRLQRVMTILETARTPEAKELLQLWAKSPGESPLADRAKSALSRLP